MHLFNWKNIQHKMRNKVFNPSISQLSMSQKRLSMNQEKRSSYSTILCLMGLTFIAATFSNTAFASMNACPEGFSETRNETSLVCTTTQSLDFNINDLGLADHDVILIQAFGAEGAKGIVPRSSSGMGGKVGDGGTGGEARTYQIVSNLQTPLTLSVANGPGQASIVSTDDTYLLVAGGGGGGGNVQKYSGRFNADNGGRGGNGGNAYGESASGFNGEERRNETFGRGGNPNGLGQGGLGHTNGTSEFLGKGGSDVVRGGDGYGGGGGAYRVSAGGGGGSYAVGYASTDPDLIPASRPTPSGSVVITMPIRCFKEPCEGRILYGAGQNSCLQVNGPLQAGEILHYVQHCNANPNNTWIYDTASGKIHNATRHDLCIVSWLGHTTLLDCATNAPYVGISWQYNRNTGYLSHEHPDGNERCMTRDSNSDGSLITTQLCSDVTELSEWDF
ncbi:hypothetical protein [uncultured Shewanella sp.]|uniref:hypothetical protein n=1 Tax=uncultured Shewanella sp. TaxID=173975 RepID=UPI0026055106|nr:hypothetical protein [uncultured Shewanella sp.]